MDVELLTYREIADRFGIQFDSARKLARRRRWARRRGNDGAMRIEVPRDYVRDVPGDGPAPSGADVNLALARLEVEVRGLRELVDVERARADAEASARAAAEADRDRWHDLARRPWWHRLVG